MIVGNAMNGAALAAERLQSEMDAGRAQIEAYLALGATPQQASAEPAGRATVAAMIPTINALAVVGVISLPGMIGSDACCALPASCSVHAHRRDRAHRGVHRAMVSEDFLHGRRPTQAPATGLRRLGQTRCPHVQEYGAVDSSSVTKPSLSAAAFSVRLLSIA
jgi:Uncharacterised protein family (UPF0014)